jgi:tetratricopeptide (TPR) repeat protein
MTKWLASAGAAVVLAACTSLAHRAAPNQAAAPNSVAGLAAAIESDSQRSDHESEQKVREDLATDAGNDANACLALDPRAVACLYGHAVALGLEARVHPIRANQLLTNMLESLGNAETADPNYDHAGPARVRALVLIRAPGWPLGPGDADAGLVAARRAVTLQPDYPPNLLTLAEALMKTGDANGARENYEHARDLAQTSPSTPDRDSWLREANQALQRK